MDQPKRAVLIMEEDDLVPAHSKPLMLETVLFCPILTWMGNRLRADGVQRFFVVCGPRFAQAARACFAEEAEVTVSERQEDLTAFLNTPDTVSVLLRPALPMEEAGPGFAYASPGYELQEAWKNGLTNRVDAAELTGGWVPVFGPETVAELEMLLRDRIVRRHMQNGVRVMDPSAVYIDPRVSIGRGTVVLPGSILRGETTVGRDCVIGPNAMVRDCAVGDETEINASQANESVIGSRTHVGPFAYIRPGCTIGDDIKVGDFVEVKNSTIGDGTKISHLTYVFGVQHQSGGPGDGGRGLLHRGGQHHYGGGPAGRAGRGQKPAEEPRGLGGPPPEAPWKGPVGRTETGIFWKNSI